MFDGSPQARGNRSHRRFAPVFEGLEIREVPSSSSLIAASGGLDLTPASTGIVPLQSTGDTHAASSSPASASARRFKGPFVVGAPEVTDQVSQTYMFGGGISTAFLHGDLQLAFAMPKDPAQPIFGQAVMTVKNVSNTGNQLILDLRGDPTSLDRAGRPTRFTWTQNPAQRRHLHQRQRQRDGPDPVHPRRETPAPDVRLRDRGRAVPGLALRHEPDQHAAEPVIPGGHPDDRPTQARSKAACPRLARFAGRCAATGNPRLPHSPMIVTVTVRRLGLMSHSSRKICCQVPSSGRPSAIGTVRLGPSKVTCRWECPLPSCQAARGRSSGRGV